MLRFRVSARGIDPLQSAVRVYIYKGRATWLLFACARSGDAIAMCIAVYANNVVVA